MFSRSSSSVHAIIWFSTILAVACTARPPRSASLPLNSERIEKRFGSYGIEIITQTPRVRVSNLYSNHQQARTCRTLAVVRFSESFPSSLDAEHNRIINGESLGAVLKKAGWKITKRTRHIGTLESGEFHALGDRLMKLPASTRLAYHLYDLSVHQTGPKFHYAAIAEIHHPAYLSISQLASIYGHSHTGPMDRQSDAFLSEVVQELSNLVLETQE